MPSLSTLANQQNALLQTIIHNFQQLDAGLVDVNRAMDDPEVREKEKRTNKTTKQ